MLRHQLHAAALQDVRPAGSRGGDGQAVVQPAVTEVERVRGGDHRRVLGVGQDRVVGCHRSRPHVVGGLVVPRVQAEGVVHAVGPGPAAGQGGAGEQVDVAAVVGHRLSFTLTCSRLDASTPAGAAVPARAPGRRRRWTRRRPRRRVPRPLWPATPCRSGATSSPGRAWPGWCRRAPCSRRRRGAWRRRWSVGSGSGRDSPSPAGRPGWGSGSTSCVSHEKPTTCWGAMPASFGRAEPSSTTGSSGRADVDSVARAAHGQTHASTGTATSRAAARVHAARPNRAVGRGSSNPRSLLARAPRTRSPLSRVDVMARATLPGQARRMERETDTVRLSRSASGRT